MKKTKLYSLTKLCELEITIQNKPIEILATAEDIHHVMKKGLTNILNNERIRTFKNFRTKDQEAQFDIFILNNKLRAIKTDFTFYTTITVDELLETMLHTFIYIAIEHPNILDKIDKTHAPENMKNDTIYAILPVKKFSLEENTAIVEQTLQIILENKIANHLNVNNSEKTYDQIIHELKKQDQFLDEIANQTERKK